MNQANKCKADLMIAVQAAQNGDWETAHNIAQDYSDPTANWIHAVLHKIEGDIGNSRYWYAKTAGADGAAKYYEDFNDVQEELIAIHHSLK